MADGFALLGNALGGSSEKAYQEGLALGANTQNALAQARARVDENTAKQGLADVLSSLPGVSPEQAAAASTTLRAGGDLGDAIDLALKSQTLDFNKRVADTNTPLDVAQRIKLAQAEGPVEQYYKVGGGYGNKFDSAAGITPLGDALGTDGGGQSAALQLIHEIEGRERARRGDPNFSLSPRQAIMIARETQRLTDVGGVPGVTNLADALGLSGDVPPAPAAPVQGPGPTAAAQPAAAAPPAAPTAPSVTPIATVAQAGANAGEIERQKVIGRERAQAYAGLPQAQAALRNQTQNVDAVVGNIDKALGITDWSAAGPAGAVLSNLAFTNAGELRRIVDVIKANTGFQQLQQMRAENATGAGLGQIAVQELAYLQAALGNLDTAQTPEDLAKALMEVRQRYSTFRNNMEQDFKNKISFATGGAPIPGVGDQTAAPGAPPAGVITLDAYLKSKGH